MFDQWENLLPNLMTPQAAAIFLLVLLVVITLVVLVVKRFHRTLMPQSLRNRLPLAFLGVAIVSVGVMSLALAVQIEATLETQKGNDFLVQTELSANRLAEQIGNQISRLEDMNSGYNLTSQIFFARSTLDNMSPDKRAAFLQNQEEKWINPDEAFLRRTVMFNSVSVKLNEVAGNILPLTAQILVTDQYGGLAGAIGEEPEHYYFGDKDWWQTALNSEQEDSLFVGRPYIAEDGETVLIDIVMPLPKFGSASDIAESKYQGVMRAKLKLSELALLAESGLGENMEFALLDKETGMWLFSSKSPQKVGTTVSDGVRENIESFPLNWGIDPDETGESVIHSYAVLSSSPEQPYLDDLGLAIVLQQSASVALSNRLDFIQPVLIGGGFALLLAGIAGYFIARQISRPIISLSNTAAAMAGGQLGQTAPEFGVSELKTLASSFNRMTDQLQQMLLDLEQQVVARTERLEIVATLGERLSSILNVEDLLNEVVNQIQARFGYYHAHIYLLDKERQNLVVAAGTGSAGAEMKATGHSISIDAKTSLVARAARKGKIVRVDNVREAVGWLPNPLLPDTCSEMAVPIMLEGQVVGVLDVQENRVAGLDEGDAGLLRSLANQVAVAIRNARLFEEVETALSEARMVQEKYLEQTWQQNNITVEDREYVYAQFGAPDLTRTAVVQANDQALAHSKPAVVTVDDDFDNADLPKKHKTVVAPISLGVETIGTFQLHALNNEDDSLSWSDEDLGLIEIVLDQLAQTAENLRLFDETRERASREQILREITEKMRASTNLEQLLKITSETIGQHLAAEYIRLDVGIKS